jgi:Mrp family chromosome partitioning ATPase
MPPSKDTIVDLLRSVKAPGASAGLADTDALVNVAACEGAVSIRLCLPEFDDDDTRGIVADAIAQTLVTKTRDDPINSLKIDFVDESGTVLFTASSGQQQTSNAGPKEPDASATGQSAGHRPIPGLDPTRAQTPQDSASGLPGVKHVIAVGAGKGGVGKSTIATNLAVGLARTALAAGLARRGHLRAEPAHHARPRRARPGRARRQAPALQSVHGIKAITVGKLVEAEKPLIWRGPMAHGAFQQLTNRTNWGELDRLIIDLPPGTGDVPLTMAQSLPTLRRGHRLHAAEGRPGRRSPRRAHVRATRRRGPRRRREHELLHRR